MKPRIIVSLLLVVVVLLLTISYVVHAEATPPTGACPAGFTQMAVMSMTDMDHIHAGLKADLNGDGQICMKVATDGVHVHVDNVITGK